MPNNPIDPVALTAELVRCPSVTPAEAGALGILKTLLESAGFECTRVDRAGISNLFARWGRRGANRSFGFNGHTDVVPVGDENAWNVDPFGAEIKGGFLWGRGSTDMKSAVAAFAAAAVDFVQDAAPDGAIILAITGDEEADATDGTVAILDWMSENNEHMTDCLVGEPTCPNHMGEAMKNGRRGSMTAFFTAKGVQGHTAYPERAKNPVPVLAALMDQLSTEVLDEGTEFFDPSTLAVTTFDTGNRANNVIPASCRATANIRFNDSHTSASLTDWLASMANNLSVSSGVEITFTTKVSGESFVTPAGPLTELVGSAVLAETGTSPKLSTSGGTSDARFVKDHCPVVEFGLVGRTMHEVDERVEVAQIIKLKTIYGRILRDYFR